MNTNSNSGDLVIDVIFALLICTAATLIIISTMARMAARASKFSIICLLLYISGVIYGFFFNDFFGFYYYSFPGVLKPDTMLEWIIKGHDYVDLRYRENEKLVASLRFVDTIRKSPAVQSISQEDIIAELNKIYEAVSKSIREKRCGDTNKEEKFSKVLQFSFDFFYYLFYMHLHGAMISPLALWYTIEFFLAILAALAISSQIKKAEEEKWQEEFKKREENFRNSRKNVMNNT